MCLSVELSNFKISGRPATENMDTHGNLIIKMIKNLAGPSLQPSLAPRLNYSNYPCSVPVWFDCGRQKLLASKFQVEYYNAICWWMSCQAWKNQRGTAGTPHERQTWLQTKEVDVVHADLCSPELMLLALLGYLTKGHLVILNPKS